MSGNSSLVLVYFCAYVKLYFIDPARPIKVLLPVDYRPQ